MTKSKATINSKGSKVKQWLKAQIPGYFFVMPGFIFVFIFMIYPLLYSLFLSFCNYNFAFDTTPKFVGLQNYFKMWTDSSFIASLNNTMFYSLFFFTSVMVMALVIAIILDKRVRGSVFFRTAIFLPVVIPLSLTGIVFQWILNENYGLFNFFLSSCGLDFLTRNWLGDSNWAMLSIVGVSLWKYLGLLVVLYLAGLQSISKELYEAATVDGASEWQRIRHITLPCLRESFVICGIWSIIQSVKVFEQPFIMTKGGPGTSTLVLYQYTWNNAFKFYEMGYASAIAYVMAGIILALSLINFRLSRTE